MNYLQRHEYESYGENCILGKKPPCVCACPLNLDVAAIIGHVQNGNFTAAYKQFRNQALFPAIVCELCAAPCETRCVRAGKDQSVRVRLLERAVVAYTKTDEPYRFNLPKKRQKIAVIGGGLAGLTCALRMGAKNYDVTLYEAREQLGGRLNERMDPAVFLPEIERQMQFARCAYRMNRRVASLDEIEFDAAYIATGEGGEDFGLLDGLDGKAFGAGRAGVFLGGALLGAAPVEDIGQAIVAAYSMEKYLKIQKMDGIPESFMITESVITKDADAIPCAEAVEPAGDGRYTKEQAVAESARCLKCDCTVCRDACELFDYFQRTPRQIVLDAFASLYTSESLTKQTTSHVISSCTMCGLCGKLCPKGVDIGRAAYDFRHFKAQDKTYPPGYSDFFIRDMLFSNTAAALSTLVPGQERARYAFFPGCQLGASNPLYVSRAYACLLDWKRDTALLLKCCGAPADWGADAGMNRRATDEIREDWIAFGRPVMVCACPTCIRQLNRFLPEIPCVSLYEVFAENGLPAAGRVHMDGTRVSVFDPCSSSAAAQKSVRDLLAALGMWTEELPYHGEKAQCCGFGGNVRGANPSLADRIAARRIEQSAVPYINYCTNCRDTFAQKGKECFHILDLLFDLDPAEHRLPSLGARRRNRLEAKMRALKLLGMQQQVIDEERSDAKVEIPPELLEKLRREMILEQEAARVIQHCEDTGRKLYDPETGCMMGHARLGRVTFWVVYKKQGERFVLQNAYSHRIQLLEDDDPAQIPE
jgi:Fe-S oxidoreductase